METSFTRLLGIDHPVMQASIGPWTSVELSAAVSAAGAIGSLGTAMRSAEQTVAAIRELRARTDRPFAVNFTLRPFDEEVFEAALAEAPPVVSLAAGARLDLVERAHEAGALFVQQVNTVEQAREALVFGADVLIAQGAEAGGFGGSVSTMALLPQVVDVAGEVPVLAAGGIADGRGLAAALVLGAAGVNAGTRFLATYEARIAHEWAEAIVAARSEDALKLRFADEVFPPPAEGGYQALPRALRTPWIDRAHADEAELRAAPEPWQAELVAAVRAGRAHELVPFCGQTAGLIHEVRSAAEVVRDLVDGAEAALARAPRPRARVAH